MTVKYSRRRSEWESSVQCITLILTIIVPYMLLVQLGRYVHFGTVLVYSSGRTNGILSTERPRTLNPKP